MEIVGTEINFVVQDSLQALAIYQKFFDLEVIEATDFPKGQNEVVFTLYGTRFKIMDENVDFGLVAPNEKTSTSIWFNITVPDIYVTFDKAIRAGSKPIQQVTELPDMGLSNAVFVDPFGHVWMLHQIHKVVSFEKRVELNKE